MQSPRGDTIVALATPPGRGGIAVIRVSGASVEAIARAMLGKLPPPRVASYSRFLDNTGAALDYGLAIYFPAPASFTGEDVLELHGHGGTVVVDLLLKRIVALGARSARPGEFSERAFLNGKLDLVQAEAVADLVDSSSEAAARSALGSLSGAFSEELHRQVDALASLRAYIEAALDFPEEDIDYLADTALVTRLESIAADLDRLVSDTQQGMLLRDGARIVLLGPPNAGKSSLLNALARTNRAIVSATPGTTRDTVELTIQIDGLPVTLIDTAGLREANEDIEQEGIRRAREAARQADIALLVLEYGDPVSPRTYLSDLPAGLRPVLVWNKIDLADHSPAGDDSDELYISVKTGAGLPRLKAHIKSAMGFQTAGEAPYIARRRHLDAIDRARDHFEHALAALRSGRSGELVAEDLRLAQDNLNEVTGKMTADDLLGRIFSEFCIGK